MVSKWCTSNKMYHCSPVRLVSQRNIGLTNIGRHGIEKLTKEKFDPLWSDSVFNHPFMTVRKKNLTFYSNSL